MVKAETGLDVELDEWLEAYYLGTEDAGEGDYGPTYRWRFLVGDQVRSVFTSQKWTPRAKSSKLYFSMAGEPYAAGVAIDTEVLDGMAVEVMFEGDVEKFTIGKVRPRVAEALEAKAVKLLNTEEDERWADESDKDAPF